MNNLYQDHFKRQQKLNELTKKYQGQENDKCEKVSILGASNKVLLKKFVRQFRNEIAKFTESSIFKLNFNQLNQVLKNLNFLAQTISNNEDSQNPNLSESSIAQTEKKLILELFENLKDNQNFINIDNLFTFLLAILNLYEAYLLKIHQLGNPEENSIANDDQISNTDSKKSILKDQNIKILAQQKKKEDRKQILLNLNIEMMDKIKNPSKYGGMDEENNFIIPIMSGRIIFKDFNLFYLNWSSLTYINRIKKKIVPTELTFKPQINQRSIKMSNAYRQKMQNVKIIL